MKMCRYALHYRRAVTVMAVALYTEVNLAERRLEFD